MNSRPARPIDQITPPQGPPSCVPAWQPGPVFGARPGGAPPPAAGLEALLHDHMDGSPPPIAADSGHRSPTRRGFSKCFLQAIRHAHRHVGRWTPAGQPVFPVVSSRPGVSPSP